VSSLPAASADLAGATLRLAADNKPYWCTGTAWVDLTLTSGDDSRINSLELELAIATANPEFFKEFEYTGDVLDGFTLYADDTKVVALLAVSFNYTGENLTRKTILRSSDNASLQIDFNYSGDSLISQARVIT